MDPIDLTGSTDRMTQLVAGTTDDHLDAPTPSGLTVRQLLGHVHGLAGAFRDAATKQLSPAASAPPDPAASVLPHDWREAIPLRLTALAQAWRDPAAWAGMTRAGGLDMPGHVAATVAVDELVVHAWDLARGTGQGYEPDPPALDVAEGFCASIPEDPDARRGLFGPRVAVPQGSSQLDRTIGLSGRDPAWQPA